jgi:hypothetical protein
MPQYLLDCSATVLWERRRSKSQKVLCDVIILYTYRRSSWQKTLTYVTIKFQEFQPILLPVSFTYKIKRKYEGAVKARKNETKIIWKNVTNTVFFLILGVTNALPLYWATQQQQQQKESSRQTKPVSFTFKKSKSADPQYDFQEALLRL